MSIACKNRGIHVQQQRNFGLNSDMSWSARSTPFVQGCNRQWSVVSPSSLHLEYQQSIVRALYWRCFREDSWTSWRPSSHNGYLIPSELPCCRSIDWWCKDCCRVPNDFIEVVVVDRSYRVPSLPLKRTQFLERFNHSSTTSSPQ